MQLYNTLTGKKETFRPIKENFAGIYTCGPTVYNFAHIGNMRTYIFEDVLQRVFSFIGYETRRVMNITDVGHLTSDSDEGEDKMEVGARREGKTAREIADFYSDAFFRDFKSLNCVMPDVLAKATDHIKEMIDLVKKIEERGYAYKISDGIYFDTAKLPDYGKLAGKKFMGGIKEGARVQCNPEKRSPADFALWKFSPAGQKRQMEWDSPWGRGFPGWHIECSAMSMKYLGKRFDIHCGGTDHITIHHTNEIAQSESATGKKWVNYWLHGEFLIMDKNSKMSKSADNFITVSTLSRRGIDPLAYRYLCYSAHYRKQLEFSLDSLKSAGKSLDKLRGMVAEHKKASGKAASVKGKDYRKEFENALVDDLNMPKALSVLWETLKNPLISENEKYSFSVECDRVLALDIEKEEQPAEIDAENLRLIKRRETARKEKNFGEADEIRRVLREKGIFLEDTPSGTKWKKLK